MATGLFRSAGSRSEAFRELRPLYPEESWKSRPTRRRVHFVRERACAKHWVRWRTRDRRSLSLPFRAMQLESGQILQRLKPLFQENFERFGNARKFNCYAGLAPFKHESGSSIKGRSRVSHLANKEAKALLNLAASCAIRCDQELKHYYQKRVSEGKRKMSCLNIIRSKLVARMFAVIKRQTPYQEYRIAA